MNRTQLIWFFCIITGAIFLLSGFAKAVNVGAFANMLVQYGFPSLTWAAPLIVLAEIAAGSCLLFRIYPKQVALFSMMLVIVFSLAFLFARLSGNVTECGCFGSLKILELSPTATFIRNIFLIVILFVVWRFSNDNEQVKWRKYAIAVATLLIASFLCGNSFAGKIEHRKRHPMYERAIRETSIPELMQIAPDSTYLVFILSYRCQSCWNNFDNIKRYYDSGLFDNITVFMGGRDSLHIFCDYFQPAFPLYEMEEKELTRIADTAPTMYYIQNDTIKCVVEGNVPTLYMFKRNYLTN
jgi:uncharacterized membrane protein YphA (DoxX/SURF4 family)